MSQPDQLQSQTLVTVESFIIAGEANLALAALEQEGITGFLQTEDLVETLWYIGGAVGGIKLQVAESEFDQASEILAKIRKERNQRQIEECDEVSQDVQIYRAFKASVFGLFLLPVIFHIYSLRLLSQVSLSYVSQSSNAIKRRYYLAYVVNALVFIALLSLIYSNLRSQ